MLHRARRAATCGVDGSAVHALNTAGTTIMIVVLH